MSRPRFEVAQVVRIAGDRFRNRYRRALTWPQVKVLNAITRCRTQALGGHRKRCERCGHDTLLYHSCRNRHCPKCQTQARNTWVEKRQQELLPVGYCRVESGRADRPFHRPLNQTARAVFPQAAFLSCSSFGIRCVAAGGGFVRTAFGSFAKGTIQFHDISAFPIARTFTTEYGDFPLQRAFWTRQRRCSKQRSETLCLPSRS